jgi:valyl-tRNA synthetase
MTQVPQIEPEMPKAYEAARAEPKWFRFWLEKDYFRADIDPDKKPFTIMMPLPNVTGDLHMGHVCFLTPEDILTRWHRMKGDSALWLPGIDHSGIGAQVVVERMLAEEGLTRYDIGREKFLERMHRWADQCRKTITEQEQRMGSSCDWSRERYTLEEGPSRAVRTAFVRLYDKGLIYRGERIINWCPRCATAISDLEVDHKDLTGNLWYVRYPLADGSGYVTVATTRPETILGDTAVAVNPDDERFKDMVGKKVILPAVKREIPIIADGAVDPAFGTGAVKITPQHDPVDFEVAQRHNLPLVNILNGDATMNENAGPYEGMDRFACREAIVADLEKDGLLVKIEPYSHSVGHCMRCQTVIEPLASLQWFINTKPLAGPAIDAVVDGRIRIVPERFTKVYLNWMENIRDWCISRQLWWGHRIPVWYCPDCNEVMASVEAPKSCTRCGSDKLEQEPDVLDTWFSSALWPHSTLGWPDDTEDLRYFYPTSVMETGYDILFFWVARMIMMGLEDAGDIPFHTIYLHGLLRDEKGAKLSKVMGHKINPIDTVDEYGADALRFAIMTGTSPGNDIKLGQEKLEAGRNFANKLWNATRFVVRSIESSGNDLTIDRDHLPREDRWILSRLNRTVSSVTGLLDDFQPGEALRQIHDFLWGEFCDWYIEVAKIRLNPEAGTSPSPIPVLVHTLETSLRLLHPYMPFITEELWQHLRQRLPTDWQPTESIVVAQYPEVDTTTYDAEAERVMGSVVEIVRAIRNVRTQHKVEPARWIEAKVFGGELTGAIQEQTAAIETLARARPVTFRDSHQPEQAGDNDIVLVLKETEVVIPMESMVDLAAERARLGKEIAESEADVARLETRLSDKAFLSKAPTAVVDRERDRLAERKDRLERLRQELERFS